MYSKKNSITALNNATSLHDQPYMNVAKNHFGFKTESAINLNAIYNSMCHELGIKKANLLFAQAMAGVCYNGVPWDFFTGRESDKTSKEIFIKYGLSKEEAADLTEEIKKQHDNASGEGKVDFSHMFFTIATYLYDGSDNVVSAIGSHLFCAYCSDEIAAGYGGDIYGISVPGMQIPPLMGNNDYMSEFGFS